MSGNEFNLLTWEDFETELRKLGFPARSLLSFLYRGHGNHKWQLRTTLERKYPYRLSLLKYYGFISRAKPQIETFTGVNWKTKIHAHRVKWLDNPDTFTSARLLTDFPDLDYMIYLRHHGFPSPLLDWTRSPYIAAYFAFSDPTSCTICSAKKKEYVSIYVYRSSQTNTKMKTVASPNTKAIEPFIYTVGFNVKSHSRHFLQQSEYTICVARTDEEVGSKAWHYASHEDVFARNEPNQDYLLKFNIPTTERSKVLELLDSAYNINGYSLFGSVESLMDTMAFRVRLYR
jgi:hypothetical protein